MAAEKVLPNGLTDVHRFITTHNESGKAVFSDAVAPEAKWQEVGKGHSVSFFLGYTTSSFPASMKLSDEKAPKSEPEDIVNYRKYLETPPELSISTGTVCRFVDFAPATEPMMHRTVSLDYGVVLEGTLECILDSGEVRTMHKGDLCVQRGTNHAWKNVTQNGGWARMMFVLIGAEPLVVAGKTLGENFEKSQEAFKPNY